MGGLSTTAAPAQTPRPGRTHRPPRGPTLVAVLVGMGLIIACRLWLLAPVIVASDSMDPALKHGGLALLLKPDPGIDRAGPGSLVVFPHPDDGSPTVKRVVAIGGQSVAIEDSVLVVDGQSVDEPFVDSSLIDGTWFGPVAVPPGHVFVMGDNRGVSIDSRHFGSIPVEDLEATVLLPQN